MKITYQTFCFVLLGSVMLPSLAVDVPPGQIDAALKAIAQLQKDVATLQVSNNSLKQRLATLSRNSVLALNGKLALGPDSKTALFTGVNVQITNGAGSTATTNGLGNLIVGYKEPSATYGGIWLPAPIVCSDGQWANKTDCEVNRSVWGSNLQSGSHNFVIGVGHTYTSYGGLVTGLSNAVNREFANVSGGAGNVASGQSSSVSGGFINTASGPYDSVSGGRYNVARGGISSVSGGGWNTASNKGSSISAGVRNMASGLYSSVSGGIGNTVGKDYSSVSGGASVTTSTVDGWAAGNLTSP
jgi:hypothetical protein